MFVVVPYKLAESSITSVYAELSGHNVFRGRRLTTNSGTETQKIDSVVFMSREDVQDNRIEQVLLYLKHSNSVMESFSSHIQALH